MSFLSLLLSFCYIFFFFNDTATTEIYTLSLHDALPISKAVEGSPQLFDARGALRRVGAEDLLIVDPPPSEALARDRKSTRLNSSHSQISYAVFCLKKKKQVMDV